MRRWRSIRRPGRDPDHTDADAREAYCGRSPAHPRLSQEAFRGSGDNPSGPTSFSAPGQTGSITVKAVDSYGNTVTSFTGTVTLTSNDPVATLPAAYTYTASDAEAHTFTYSFGTAGTARTFTATTSGSTITQSGIVVNDCILFINSNGTLSRLTDAGVATSPSASYTGGGAPIIGIALDGRRHLVSQPHQSRPFRVFEGRHRALPLILLLTAAD